MARNEITLLKSIIENIVFNIQVVLVENTTVSTLTVCNTLYLHTDSKVTIDDIEYNVDSFVINQQLVLSPVTSGDPLVDVTTTAFVIDTPTFYHGTPTKVSTKNVEDQNVVGYKGPLIWLLEWVDIEPPEDEDTSNVRATIKGANIFYLNDAEQENWSIDEHYDEVVDPMQNVSDYVYNALSLLTGILDYPLDRPKRRNHVDFGTYIDDRGYDKTILPGHLSGVQATLDIPFVVDPCECDVVEICEAVTLKINGISFNDLPAGTNKVLEVVDQDDNQVGTKVNENKWKVVAAGAPANISLNTVPFGTIPAGGSKDIAVHNTADTDVGTKIDNNEIEIGDTDVTFNGAGVTDPKAETSYAISVKDQLGNDVGAIEDQSFTSLDIEVTIPAVAINTANPYRTGQTTSFRTGDDGDLEEGNGAAWLTLSHNNGFGANTNRFTDTAGNQNYDGTSGSLADILIDWSSWDQVGDTVLGWYRVVTGPGTETWNEAIDGALASSQAGFSDWRLPNMTELHGVSQKELIGGMVIDLDYAPFNIDISVQGERLWTSTTAPSGRAYNLIENGSIIGSAKGSTISWIQLRTFTLAELGL